MTTRRTVLNVEQLGARVLPSVTVATPTTTAAKVASTTTVTSTSSTWSGSGRFTITTAASSAKTYTLQGSVEYGSNNFFAISGSVTSLGSSSSQAKGRITLTSPKGTLTLDLTGASQSAHAALPTTFTSKVVSGTGAFAHATGQGTFRFSPSLFPGIDDRGNFTVSGTVSTSSTPVPPVTKPPTTKPPTHTTTGPSWTGQGRYSISVVASTHAKTYTLQGSADFGSSGFFGVSGSITTVGNKSGHASGKIVLSDHRGTLTLTVTGSTQSANSALPTKLTYKVSGATGFFAKYAGQGAVQVSIQLFSGFGDKGHFSLAVKPSAA